MYVTLAEFKKNKYYKEMDIVVDPEFEALIPPLTEEEYEQLKENILRDEIVRDPICVWGDWKTHIYYVIDGHHRWKIVQENPNVRFSIEEENFEDREQAQQWMINNQLGRRNLTPFQRTELALKLKPLLTKQAKERMLSGKADPTQKSAGGEVRQQIADAANVSRDTVSKVEKILYKAPEETKKDLREGKVSINKAYQSIANESKGKNFRFELKTVETQPKEYVLQFEKKDSSPSYVSVNPPSSRIINSWRKNDNTDDMEEPPTGSYFEAPPKYQKRYAEIANAHLLNLGTSAHLCRKFAEVYKEDTTLQREFTDAEGDIAKAMWFFHTMYGVPIDGLDIHRETVEFTDNHVEVYEKLRNGDELDGNIV